MKGIGLYGKGMHDFVLRELEIGHRAAAIEESERCGWSALDDLSFQEYMAEQEDPAMGPLEAL